MPFSWEIGAKSLEQKLQYRNQDQSMFNQSKCNAEPIKDKFNHTQVFCI